MATGNSGDFWARQHAAARAKDLLRAVGAAAAAIHELEHGADVAEIEGTLARGLEAVAFDESRQVEQRRMAHGFLADLLAKRGDPDFFAHLRAAARCELERISALRIRVDKVDIVPGWQEPFCLGMRRNALPLADELRAPVIPTLQCPKAYGRIERAYCTCYYAVARSWFESRL